MNRDCNGDFYAVGKTEFYRCFRDGTVIKASRVGTTCPNCQRDVDAQRHGRVQHRHIVREEVLLPDFGWVPHYSGSRLP